MKSLLDEIKPMLMVHCSVPADSQDFAQIIALLGSDQNHSTFGNGTPTPQNGMMASQIATAYAAATTSGLNSAPASGSTMVSIGDGADPGDSRSGTFMCNSCKAVNIIGGNTDFYYAITVGTRIGVIHTWYAYIFIPLGTPVLTLSFNAGMSHNPSSSE